jgi:hypothetical protein
MIKEPDQERTFKNASGLFKNSRGNIKYIPDLCKSFRARGQACVEVQSPLNGAVETSAKIASEIIKSVSSRPVILRNL